MVAYNDILSIQECHMWIDWSFNLISEWFIVTCSMDSMYMFKLNWPAVLFCAFSSVKFDDRGSKIQNGVEWCSG